MISDAVNSINWKPFKLNNQNLCISHLLFVYDVLLFAKTDTCSINTIGHIIGSFCNVSGMEINFDKFKLWLSQKIPNHRKHQISNSLRINATSSIGSYLRFPLKPKYKIADFNIIIDKIRHKLQGWKMHTLSFAGCSLLISTTLNQIPCYHMQIFSLPSKTHNQIDKISKNFIWDHCETSRKTHYISWGKITYPKTLGGLDLKKSKLINAAYKMGS